MSKVKGDLSSQRPRMERNERSTVEKNGRNKETSREQTKKT